MKAVFDTKPTSAYDDDISRHYHFPNRYLSIAEKCVGDWIVLRHPRADGGNLAYFATAKVIALEPDPAARGMYYARLSDFLEFPDLVPWLQKGRYAEQALREIPQTQVGLYLRGRSVRPLNEDDFADILKVGLMRALDPRNAERLDIPSETLAEATNALSQPPVAERNWRFETILTNRIIRDASFQTNVYDAYDNRCAISKLRIFDANGNSEVHAAHIWAVADGGPDIVQNGIALSATVHWLFDHKIISLTDDYCLLIAEKRLPPEFAVMFSHFDRKLNLPTDKKNWPHPFYLAKHRETFLKANS